MGPNLRSNADHEESKSTSEHAPAAGNLRQGDRRRRTTSPAMWAAERIIESSALERNYGSAPARSSRGDRQICATGALRGGVYGFYP
jgi:hypothetical protein